MKRILSFAIMIVTCFASYAQSANYDKQVEKWLKQADKHIPDFHRDSIISVYPIYYLLAKKECRKIKFDKIPTYNEIDSCMDFEHVEFDQLLVKTTNGIWSLDGFDLLQKTFCHDWNYERTVILFNYLDSVKADKAYHLFGMYYLTLIEKDGKRTMIKEMENTWKECEISDLDTLEDWNVWHFPSKEKRTPPVLGYQDKKKVKSCFTLDLDLFLLPDINTTFILPQLNTSSSFPKSKSKVYPL